MATAIPDAPGKLHDVKLIPLRALASHLPVIFGRRPPCLTTFHRWTRRGIRGIKLESMVVGSERVTSEEAVDRFYSKLAGV